MEGLKDGSSALWFDVEENTMHSYRESELMQHSLHAHGEMPGRGLRIRTTYSERSERL